MRLVPGPKLLILLFSVSFLAVSWAGLVSPSTPEIVSEFGRGSTARGAIIGVSSLLAAIGAPVAGLLADRVGRRKVLVTSLIIFGLSGLVQALAPNFSVFLVGRGLVGLGNAGLIGLVITSISDMFPSEKAVRYIGFNGSMIGLGLLVNPLVGGFIADVSTWRFAVLVQLLAIPVAILLWRFMPEVELPKGRQLREQLSEAKTTLLSSGIARRLFVGFATFFMIFGLQVTLIPQLLVEQFEASESTRSFVFGATAIGIVVSSSLIGRLRDRFSIRFVVLSGMCLFIVNALLVGFAQSFVVILVAALINGVGESFVITGLNAEISTTAAASTRAIATWMFLASGRIGQALGSFTFGYLDSLYDQQPLFLVGAGLFGILFAWLLITTSRRVGEGDVITRVDT